MLVPAGYLYKQVVNKPDWLNAPQVEEIFSVSACLSADFADYIPHWQHNGYWFFNSPGVMQDIANQIGLSLAGMKLFYYEAWFEQFEPPGRWTPFTPEPSFDTQIQIPQDKQLRGFDVVTFSAGSSPECSPLSCNGLAAELPVNRYCLLESLAAGQIALEKGVFAAGEPGPHRLLAVYECSTPSSLLV